MSTIDIVIPCYNYARYLPGCVSSVLSQPGVDVRVLILDDASTDETSIVGQRLAATDSRVSYRRHSINHGHIATYNEGLLGWATADYSVLLSADDLLSPGSLARAANLMDAHPNIGLVYGATVHFEHESTLPSFSPCTENFASSTWSGARWIELRCRAGYNVITSPEVVVRSSVQRAAGGYRPELPHAGDLEMWLRIASLSDIAYISRTPQAFYRVHSESMMRTRFRGRFLDLHQRRAAFNDFFDHAPPSLPNSTLLRDLAQRSLAKEALWEACRAYDRGQVEQSGVRDLIHFALSTCAAADSLPEYRALLRRRWLGSAVCSHTQLFAFPALAHRMRHAALKRRWQTQGV